MTDLAKDSAAIDAINLLTHYGFDLGGHTSEYLVDRWLQDYPSLWLRSAVVEALYQGRYKAISVEQILSLWQRREHPVYHYSHEFERIVCGRFPRNLNLPKSVKRESDRLARVTQLAESLEAERVQAQTNPFESSPPVLSEPPTSSVAQSSAEAHNNFVEQPLSNGDSTTEGDRDQMQAQTGERSIAGTAQAAAESDQTANRATGSNQPIHQFVPAPEASEFYDKLKAVAYSDGTETPN